MIAIKPGTTFNESSLGNGEGCYVPLEDGESFTIIINSISILITRSYNISGSRYHNL